MNKQFLESIIKKTVKKQLNEFEFKEEDNLRFVAIFKQQLKKNGIKAYNHDELIPYISGGQKIYTMKFTNDKNQSIRLNWKSNNTKNHLFSISIWKSPRVAPHSVLNVEFFTLRQIIEASVQLLEGKNKLKIRGVGSVEGTQFIPARGPAKPGGEFADLNVPSNKMQTNQAEELIIVPEIAPKEKLNIEMPMGTDELFADLTVDEMFDRMNTYIEMIKGGMGGKKSLIICGGAGIGKTFSVLKALKGTDYKHIKGSITSPQLLYKLLYKNNKENRILVLDDLDVIFTNKEMTNILKGALDSTEGEVSFTSNTTVDPSLYLFYRQFDSLSLEEIEDRLEKLHKKKIIISNSDIYKIVKDEQIIRPSFQKLVSLSKNPELPDSIFPSRFVFKGKIIFLSNLYLNSLPGASISRSLKIEIELDFNQILDRIYSVMDYLEIPGSTREHKMEVWEFFKNEISKSKLITKMDFRTFAESVAVRMTNNPSWKKYIYITLKDISSTQKHTIVR